VHYPVNLVVEGRPVLVVGAGVVAARKVVGLVACGARVTVVAPEIGPELAARADITVARRAYRRGEVAGYWLAFTATDDEATNRAVFEDGVAAGIWVNSADDPARCSFTLPAVHRQGSVLLTASSGGRSPALSSWLRGWLEREVSPAFADIAERLAAERAALHDAGCSTEGRDWARRIEQLLAEMASPDAPDASDAVGGPAEDGAAT
jgi:siroheme synthase-like protein